MPITGEDAGMRDTKFLTSGMFHVREETRSYAASYNEHGHGLTHTQMEFR